MVDTIESFVAKLKAEGVEAGQVSAQKIREDAEAEAKQIVKQARSEAERIVAEANRQAEDRLAKSQTEIKLAVRDAGLRLRETLGEALNVVLAGPVEQQLSRADFLAPLLHDIVVQYAQADRDHAIDIDINVPEDLRKELADWAIGELREASEHRHVPVSLKGELAEAADEDLRSRLQGRHTIDLHGTLRKAGIEYSVGSGGTVEVTVESVTEILRQLIGPRLREMLDEAMKEKG